MLPSLSIVTSCLVRDMTSERMSTPASGRFVQNSTDCLQEVDLRRQADADAGDLGRGARPR